MKPFLKWAGNKYPLRNEIVPLLEGKGKRYIEPFLGSGAIYGQLSGFRSYWLNDKCFDVANLFYYVEDFPLTLTVLTQPRFNNTSNTFDQYYANRNTFNACFSKNSKPSIYRAMLFLYLNRHCFNGLTRFNNTGGFNVPFGSYKNPYFPENEIRLYGEKLRIDRVLITNHDFQRILDDVREGDVVYCDPPYYPTSTTSSFTGYTNGWKVGDDDVRLATLARAAADRGAHVVISNSDTEFIRNLYGQKGATQFIELQAKRSISAKGSSRGNVNELIIVF